MRLSRTGRRAIRDGLTIAGLLFAGYLFLVVAPNARTVGFDAFAYWSVDLDNVYNLTAGAFGAFTYSPVIARIFDPVDALDWPTFLVLWTGLLVGTTIWLGWRSALVVLAFPPVAVDLYHGNVHVLIAAAIALGFRYPAAWAFVVLTKFTPGVGLLWFVARREWRAAGIAFGVTGVLLAVSLVIDGALWLRLLDSVTATLTVAPSTQVSLPIPIWFRLPAAIALVVWGASTDRRWTVPVAATLALPYLWFSGLAILAALWPIAQRRPELRLDAQDDAASRSS